MFNIFKSKLFSRISVIGLMGLLSGCGQKVEVPPAYVGRILTKNGYAPKIVTPSKFRLPRCFQYCDKLVLLQTIDSGFKEEIKVFMPKDRLNITVDVRGTLSIPSELKIVDAIFNRVPPKNDLISLNAVYTTYGEQAIRGMVRSELVKYTIGEILSQREAIGESIHSIVSEKLKKSDTPIQVSRFVLANVQPPAVIVEAQEAAKEREIDIQKAEADAQVDLVKAEKDLEIAKKNRLVEKEKALAIAEQNEIAADSITPQLLAYRRLEVAERIYTELSKSSNTIILPADSSSFSSLTDDVVLAKMLEKGFKK